MKTQIRLNLYERGIVEALEERFGYSAEEARQLTVQYIGVIRKLGGYDTRFDHAERLDLARKQGYTPEQWLEKIRLLDAEEAKDEGIPHLEGPYESVR
ncbi:hypothetical protein [Cohnella zeiphila]|uniref:Uncharacterized protein n=1 Tax=Cohnella zeiphila TaxID=2761120 RepID=A0A7X0SP37_9BACL|nr:hypothetical protein [Cohnella zeiphila]MBB6732434.1 hypothetical protein [Cohnella zeiphila]